jgi:hypothetical protein
MNGIRCRTSAAARVLVVALCTLGGAGAVDASMSAGFTRSETGPPSSLSAAVADEIKAQGEAKRADAEDAKATNEERRAVAVLEKAHEEAAAADAMQQRANQEQHAAAAESDSAKAAQLQAAAAQDAQRASSDEALAARELHRAEIEATQAKREETLAAEDREKAETDAASAVGEQRRAQRQAAGAGKILICHATGSAGNPYVEIEVDRSGLNGHGGHPADLIPAPAEGCPRKSSHVQLDEAKRASAPEEAKAATSEEAKAAGMETRSRAEEAKAREEESLGKSDLNSARQESSSAAATAAKATQEHQTAASETDPAKAAQLEAVAVGDDRLAASQQLLSEIDKSLAELEETLATQDAALAAKEHSAAETARAAAEDGQELAQEEAEASGKVLICHATGSAGDPYVEIEVPQVGLAGHGDDASDIVPAPVGGCPAAADAKAVALAEADDARTRVPLPGGPLRGDMSANESSVAPGEAVRLTLAAVNPQTRPVEHVMLCAGVPPGFSLISAPGARLVDGAPCRTIARLGPKSVATLALHLRLNTRAGGTARVRLPLLLSVGSVRAPLAQLALRVSAGSAPVSSPAGAPPVTG